jgi:hypothetical protein
MKMLATTECRRHLGIVTTAALGAITIMRIVAAKAETVHAVRWSGAASAWASSGPQVVGRGMRVTDDLGSGGGLANRAGTATCKRT